MTADLRALLAKATQGEWSIDPANGDIVSGPLNVAILYACKPDGRIVSDLEKLAARVEALSGPCVGTDADIRWAIGDWINIGGWRRKHKVTGATEVFTYQEAPRYTRSLDAAMSLLDPSWFFHLSRFSPECDGRGQAHVYPNRGLGDDYESEAATPALALLAAALRARTLIPSSRREGGEF